MRLENSATITKYVCQSLLQFLKALFTLWYNYWMRFFILIQFLNEVISQSVTIIKWFFTVRYNYWMRFSFSVTIIECFCCTLLQLRTLFATMIEAIILAVLSILNWYFIVGMYLVLLPTACYIWQLKKNIQKLKAQVLLNYIFVAKYERRIQRWELEAGNR